MITKPTNSETESKAHVAVGRAMAAGGVARDTSRPVGRAAGAFYLKLFLAVIAFGLIMSSTPWWFKLAGLAVLAAIFALARARTARASAKAGR